jgi:hypothetical protein
MPTSTELVELPLSSGGSITPFTWRTKMPVDEKTREALDLNSLSLPASPVVVAVEAEDYTDSTGEPALRILVTIDEATDIENFRGEDIGQLKRAIHDSLRRHGVTLFPYIFLAKPSELAEADD